MSTPVPAPILDLRNGDLVVAEAIGSLPAELSDRSDSNPAVVIIEACGSIFDKLIFQINQWPQAVIQKTLSLIGVNLGQPAAAFVNQTFTLSSPQQNDTVISAGTQVATSDGTIVFSTLVDLMILPYVAGSGTVTITAGSTAVTGSGTSFPTDGSWTGQQIRGAQGNWYTIASVANSTSLTLTSNATVTQTGVSFVVGPVSGVVEAQCTTTGAATNVGAGALTTLTSSPAGVASTINNAPAFGGADLQTTTNAVAQAPLAFAARDMACSVSDYQYFAANVLGPGGRCAALAGYSGATAKNGFTTIAVLSPNWTTSTPVSAGERAAVIRDATNRNLSSSTLIDVAASITSYTPAICFYRQAQVDQGTARANVAAAVNAYLSPNTYPFNPSQYPTTLYRPIFATDLAAVAAQAVGVDRILEINGTLAVGASWTVTAHNVILTNGQNTATANAGDIGAGLLTAGQTFISDPNVGSDTVYLVTGISGTTLTLSSNFAGQSATGVVNYFNSGDTNLTNWFTLPYSNLSVNPATPSASVMVVGSV